MAQLSANSAKLLHDKNYYQEGESSWGDICKRVSTAVGGAELTEELRKKYIPIFYDMMFELDFIPSTPCLMNAGTSNGQLSSCFILDVDDNIESIFEANARCAKIFQKNGGVGFNLSRLRPKRAVVETSKGYSCGVVGWMRIFDLTASVVTENNSRKGAIKIDLNDWHPDIYDFIHAKDNETVLNCMNISVSISDKFMEAVKHDRDWDLIFPDYTMNNKEIFNKEWDGDIEKWMAKGYPVKIYQTVKARDLYREIMDSAWRTGEPGVSYRDTMNRANPNPHLGRVDGTNPCLYKDTLMLTVNGLIRIKDIYDDKIYNGNEFSFDSRTWIKGRKKTVKVVTENGFEYIVTPDHRFMLANDEWCEAKDLKNKRIKFFVKEMEWKGVDKFEGVKNYKLVAINYITNGILHGGTIPDWILCLPKPQVHEFLQGYFYCANFHKELNRYELITKNKEMLQQFQSLFLLFGIKARLLPEGSEYKLCVDKTSRLSTAKFIDSDCQINIQDIDKHYYDEKVVAVEPCGYKEVWDFSEPKLNCGIANGAYVHNCSEFCSIPRNSCNLGSINLVNMVVDGQFDIEKFKNTVRNAVRFLDNMITINKLPLDVISEVTKGVRSVGLGVMGLADCLYKLGIPYQSKKGKDFIDNLFSIMYNTALETSMELAEEKGVYDEWEGSVWYQKGIKVRNSNFLSIAPTGSISFIAGVSSGIEPNYGLAYTRRTIEGIEYFVVNPIFEEQLDKLGIKNKEEIIKKIIKNNGSCRGIAEIPKSVQDVFVTTYDITPKEHTDVLAIIQKHVDLSVSKTVNVPEEATVEEIEDIYLYAWSKGCKGITVYRNNSRSSQTLSIRDEEGNEIIFDSIQPVSRSTMGKTFGVTIDKHSACGKMYITINRESKTNSIVETFVNVSKHGMCKSNIDGWNRLISLNLRSGVKVSEIIDQLKGISCPACHRARAEGKSIDGLSCPDIMARALEEEYLQKNDGKEGDGEVTVVIENCCPKCNSPDWVREEGCHTCKECGYSLCN